MISFQISIKPAQATLVKCHHAFYTFKVKDLPQFDKRF